MDIDKLFVRADRMIPRLQTRPYEPQVVMEGGHFHHGRPGETLIDFKGELGSVVPPVLFAADDVRAIEPVEVGEIETAFVDDR